MKNTIAFCLVLAAAAASAYAIEKSSAVPVTNADSSTKASTGSFDSHNTSFLGNMATSLTIVSNQVKNVEACNALGKVWNGTTCVDLTAAAQPISTTAVYGPTIAVKGTSPVARFANGDSTWWYFYLSCTCSVADQMPKVRRYGNLVILEPRICSPTPEVFYTPYKSDPRDPNAMAYNQAAANCAANAASNP